MDGTSVEMPKYSCHKEVWALKIKGIRFDREDAKEENRETDGSATITPEEEGYAPFKVDYAYVTKHKPEVGGYYVAYKDGYKSFSPAEAFEDGYALADKAAKNCGNCVNAKWHKDTEERKAKGQKVMGSCEYATGLMGLVVPYAAHIGWYHIEPSSGHDCPTWQKAG